VELERIRTATTGIYRMVSLSVLALLIFISVLVAARRESSLAIDTENYVQFFRSIVACQCVPQYFEPGFNYLSYSISWLSHSSEVYLGVLALLIYIGHVLFHRYAWRMVGGGEACYFIGLLFSGFAILYSTFIFSSVVNGIRQGLAAPILYFSLAFLLERRYFASLVFGVIAVSLHLSSLLYLVFFPVIFLSGVWLLVFWIVSSLVYALGLSDPLVGAFSNVFGVGLYDQVVSYSAEEVYSGFNIAFFAYTWLPWLLLAVFRLLRVCNYVEFAPLFRLYAALAMPYFYFGFSSYANRYAFSAWLFMPVIFGIMASRVLLVRCRDVGLLWLGGVALIMLGFLVNIARYV
jgi:EpsG family